MERVYKEDKYLSGGSNIINKEEYDCCLFRQDFNGSESVYFNKNEIDEIVTLIEYGEIFIHNNYSILFCKNEEILSEVEENFGCYATIFE